MEEEQIIRMVAAIERELASVTDKCTAATSRNSNSHTMIAQDLEMSDDSEEEDTNLPTGLFDTTTFPSVPQQLVLSEASDTDKEE